MKSKLSQSKLKPPTIMTIFGLLALQVALSIPGASFSGSWQKLTFKTLAILIAINASIFLLLLLSRLETKKTAILALALSLLLTSFAIFDGSFTTSNRYRADYDEECLMQVVPSAIGYIDRSSPFKCKYRVTMPEIIRNTQGVANVLPDYLLFLLTNSSLQIAAIVVYIFSTRKRNENI